ncbi:Putative FBD-associated F-box protein At1g55030 [Linum grandiflorum]
MSVEEAISCPSADIISSMPKDLKLHILGLLPMKGAAMSSALSTQWRDMWTYLPSLIFQGPEMKLTSDHICGVLRRHRGPLREFSLLLSHNSEENRGFVPARARQNHVERDIESVISVFGSNILDSLITIDEILNLLPSQTLTSLVIDYFNSTIGDRTLLMRMAMILLFSDLKTLRLSYCLLSDSVPVSFDRRFEKLTVLELRDVEFPPNSPQWKFGCPMLTTLTLDGCTCMHSSMETPAIVIEEAPKLSYFYIDGVFVSLQFNGSTPLLKQVFIRKVRLTWTVESKLLKVNGALAAVESLSVAKYFYEV